MFKRTFISPAVVLGVFLGISSASGQADVSGTWKLIVENPSREIIWNTTFVQEGEKLTVTIKGPQGNIINGEGKIQGDRIQWMILRETAEGETPIIYAGKVKGDVMEGELQWGDADRYSRARARYLMVRSRQPFFDFFKSQRWKATRDKQGQAQEGILSAPRAQGK